MNGLWRFQQEAVDKLRFQSSVLIGDEMGTGKTVEAIALDAIHRLDKEATSIDKTLVVSNLSVLSSWVDHFATWQPGLKVMVINPKDRESFVRAFLENRATVFICHWESLRLMPELRKPWFHIIGDEIHRIKNRDAQLTLNFKKLPTKFKTGLSGTPADNKPHDLWSILNWLHPKIYTSYWKFYNKYVLFVEEMHPKTYRKYRKIIGVAPGPAKELQEEMEPWFVRRLKKDVLKDLPDKYYTTLRVDLTSKQRTAYDTMKRHMISWIGEHEHQAIAAPVVIAQLVRLQQFACAYGELVQIQRSGNDVTALRLTDPSSKIDAVIELIEDTNGQVVVFAQSKQVIHLLAKKLQAKNITCALLTGDTKQEVRGQLVQEFQSGRYQVFAGTISAGGVGITLTAASTVVFIDRSWNPSQNKQAEDRLHRMGQENAVQVVTVVANETIDQERNEGIELKWEWLRELLGDV